MKDFEGRRRPVAQALGAAAIRANQFDSRPDQAGHAHDELDSGQEEIYVPLRGRVAWRSTASRSSWSPAATCWSAHRRGAR